MIANGDIIDAVAQKASTKLATNIQESTGTREALRRLFTSAPRSLLLLQDQTKERMTCIPIFV